MARFQRPFVARFRSIAVVSDVHYASPGEQARRGHELRVIANPAVRAFVKAIRRHFWMRDPFAHNDLLDRFLAQAAGADYLAGNGDYSCDTGFVGVSDEAAFASAQTCFGKLRGQFGDRLAITYGDHELGKMSLVGGRGGLRLASWRRLRHELELPPCWRREIGRYVLLGVVSSLAALPVYEPETLPAERAEWRALRGEHLEEIAGVFTALRPDQKLVLFCHDPTALPFLWRADAVRAKLGQVETTIIGHLHTKLIFWKSRLLAGMPPISFLGNSVRRMSTALHEARHWRAFHVRLCPALAGCELLKDGGFLSLRLDTEAREPLGVEFHPLPR